MSIDTTALPIWGWIAHHRESGGRPIIADPGRAAMLPSTEGWDVFPVCRVDDAADRLAALEAELASLRTDRDGAAEACRMLQEDKVRLEQDNARLRGQISAMLGELEDFAMQNDLPIENGHGYFGTGLPLRALQEWLFKQKDALAAGGDQ